MAVHKVRLVDEWRSAWRWASMQIATLAVVFGALPTDAQSAVLDVVGVPAGRVPAVLGLAFIVGRMLQRKAPE